MFTYILSDKRKPTVFKAEHLDGSEVLLLVSDFAKYVSTDELRFYTIIVINEGDNSTFQINGGSVYEAIFG